MLYSCSELCFGVPDRVLALKDAGDRALTHGSCWVQRRGI